MKRVLIAILSVFFFASVANAEFLSDVIVTSPNGIWTDSRAYATLNAAVTAVGANDREIVIVNPQVVTSLTVPSNVRLRFLRDGSITNSGYLNIQTKNIEADNRQIFTGIGNIDFAAGTVLRTAWFSNIESAFALTTNDSVTLVVSKPQTITANYSPGNNVVLKWESPGNILTIAAGKVCGNLKNIEAGNYQIFAGSGDFDFLDGTRLKLVWFNHLRSVLTWIESEKVTIVVSGTNTVDFSDAATVNESFDFSSEQGQFSISAGVTLTLYSPTNIIAQPNQQIFSGAGTVSFANPQYAAYAEWFGAASGVNSGVFINKALASAGIVEIGAGTFNVETDIIIPDNTTLRMTDLTILKAVVGITKAVLVNSDSVGGNTNIAVIGGNIDGDSVALVHGTYFDYVDGLTVKNLRVYDTGYSGIALARATNFKVKDNEVSGVVSATHVGILLGEVGATKEANDGTVSGNYTHDNGQDGILFEHGDNVDIGDNISKGNTESGIKIGALATNWRVHDNYVENNSTGLKCQGASRGGFYNNIAYKNGRPGISLEFPGAGTIDSVNIIGNICNENGQSLAAQYGIQCYLGTATNVLSRVKIADNICLDQTRGISIESIAATTITDLMISNNYLAGNTANFVRTTAGTVNGFYVNNNIPGYGESSSSSAAYDGLGQTYERMRFFKDNIPQFSGELAMASTNGTRGLVIIRGGYLKKVTAKISEAVAANSITFRVKIGGVEQGSYNLNFTDATLVKTYEVGYSDLFVPSGSVITATVQGNGALDPVTIDTDFIIEIGY